MSKNLFKYVSVLILLFFSGTSNIHAISAAELVTDVCSITADNDHNTISAFHHSDTKELVCETEEVEESENEESATKHNTLTLHNFLVELFSCTSFNEVYQSQKSFYYYKNYQDRTSTKLHVRLQVFII